jgi:hypothetical protein
MNVAGAGGSLVSANGSVKPAPVAQTFTNGSINSCQ